MSQFHQAVLAQGSDPALTSRQQFTVLDQLFGLAVRPVHEVSDVFLDFVAEVLAISVRSRRQNASEMVHACTAVLSGAPDPVGRLFDAGIDRGQLVDFLRHVRVQQDALHAAETDLALGRHDGAVRMHEVRRIMGNHPRLAPALATSAYWQDRALEWRNRIVGNYTRMLWKGASSMNRASGGRIEIDPTFHDAWIAAVSAVNRFRSDQSTFSGFLGRSLMGTYRIAASNALGLAAPGSRVLSEHALQTTVLDDAVEPGRGLPHPLEATSTSVDDEGTAVIMRALAVAARHDDARVALVVSDADPTLALLEIGLGPRVGKSNPKPEIE